MTEKEGQRHMRLNALSMVSDPLSRTWQEPQRQSSQSTEITNLLSGTTLGLADAKLDFPLRVLKRRDATSTTSSKLPGQHDTSNSRRSGKHMVPTKSVVRSSANCSI